MMSRNQREGIYAGRIEGDNYRAHKPPNVVWEGDEVLFTYPIPSASVVFGVYIKRQYPPAPAQRTRQQVIDAYRAANPLD
jgi:hypothetical protein